MNNLLDFLFGAKITIFDKYTSFLNVLFFALIAPLFVVFVHFYSNEVTMLSLAFWKQQAWWVGLAASTSSLLLVFAVALNVRLLKLLLLGAIIINGGLCLFIIWVSFTKVAVIMLSCFALVSFFIYQEVSSQVDMYSAGLKSSHWPLNLKCYIQDCGPAKIVQISKDFIQCSLDKTEDWQQNILNKKLRCQIGIGSRELFFDVKMESLAKEGQFIGFRVVNENTGDWLPFFDVIETRGVVL